ncbi:MAG: hypothetical protein UHU21_02905 [Lachnospiraceae bacterium]|nr:hypothetical protein [Lachnospiraceae bacterium]
MEKEIKNAIIESTSLSMADHGCLTFTIWLKGDGWGVGYGGYCIGHGYLGADEFKAENGHGLEAMMHIMNVVGVEKWEQLKGKYVRCKIGRIGESVDEIGNITKEKWFNIREFFKNVTD